MPDIKTVFCEEVRRLAKKEIKLAVMPLAKTIVEQRRIISDLKKRIVALENATVSTAADNTEKSVKTVAEPKLRLNAAGIVRVRSKLNLTQSEFAKLLGVSTHTVSIWELGKSSPRQDARAAICALRTIGRREIKRRLAQLTTDAE